MIETQTLITISLICLLGMMSPGPNFITVVHRAVSGNRKHSLIFSLGIAIVSALWATTTLFGMSLLFSLMPWLFMSAKIAGGIYLIYLGYKVIFKTEALAMDNIVNDKGIIAILKEGMLTNIANPKSMVFYASVFSTSVPQDSSHLALVIVIGIVGVISLSWYSFVSLLFSSQKIMDRYLHYKHIIDYLCGGFLIVFGVKQMVIF